VRWGGGDDKFNMTDFFLDLVCLSLRGVSPDSIGRVMGA
jgi:hypothetical protein